MQSTAYRYIEPLDVLFLRGNKLFGDPGSHGESLVPPWPSAASGAIRSLMLAAEGIDPAAFARGEHAHVALGTPAAPGPFTLTTFNLARKDGQGRVETLHALPADLVVSKDGDRVFVRRLQPVTLARGVCSSAPLAAVPVLAEPQRSKPSLGHWLTQTAWARYLRGGTPDPTQLMPSAGLWQLDTRVGVGLDAATGRADDGKLFSVQAVAFCSGIGFLAGIAGAELPQRGMLRLGGDGRGAAMHAVAHHPAEPDFEAIARARRCRIVLTSAGLFPQGWRLPGSTPDDRFSLPGISAGVVSAAVPRAEVVSGWDLARWQPKPAQRVAPTGSVYWLDDLDASADALRKLAAYGLWDGAADNAARRAEGFNRFTFAAY